jgi:hypothetical protein
MDVQLVPLEGAELSELQRNLALLEMWPREKFRGTPSVEDVRRAQDEGFWRLFAVRVDGETTLYAALVRVGLPYFQLVPKGMRGVRVDEGRLAVIQLLRWAFSQKDAPPSLYYYLPASYVYAADHFFELGFEPVRDEGAAAEGERLLVMDAHVYEGYEGA